MKEGRIKHNPAISDIESESKNKELSWELEFYVLQFYLQLNNTQHLWQSTSN